MSNLALKRAAKANRRKTVVAQKRKAESIQGSLPERVARAATAPIRYCLVAETMDSRGVGTVVLVRGAPGGTLTLASFLVDSWCLGIKDVFLRPVGTEEFKILLGRMERTSLMTSVDPAYARKLLRDVAAWAGTLGFAPHPDFAAIERLFGDVDANASSATFTFGHEGKPTYVAGPYDTPALSRQRIAQLTKAVGAGNFDFVLMVGGPAGDLDDDSEWEGDGGSETDWVVERQTPVQSPPHRDGSR